MIDAVATRAVSPASQEWLSWNDQEFRSHFSREPFLIQHTLNDHPLFQMDRLLELVKSLPEKSIEYNAGKIPVSVSHDQTPRNGLSAEETVRRIAECESWLVLKYIEQDPPYAELLEQCLAQVRPLSEPIAPGMMKPHAFVFITSPGSVTPLHVDPEHNFLLQIRGQKTVRMFDGNNPDFVTHEELENFYCDRGRNLVLKEENRDRGWKFLLPAGQGLHFPVTFPHWVENSDEISISFSITFRTPDLDRRRALYRTNDRLRKMGLNPKPPGRNRLRDNACYHAFRACRKIETLLRRR
ncbi:JmjC domain-containing protein [Rubinisphaera brasiliensis]|uniref:Transcription factor jumonji jmjC domain-containing protein n=1 Tax=Rubinisphaera brasiliensis (strain ATCC 49424 / DSM 5305 / JCM 21570 / IAM 15109 / NBRC 103401 / IFAM 1448) TaxID=756272 RepID=F0SQ57_RUBBR|nr:cupin domain-containing protein [Rubinisphaera brasiliensis]ADY61234.1 transcription factor jumonji jmjC domain-containing protein [Rubinisphaera brasiliensis DSM 5305]